MIIPSETLNTVTNWLLSLDKISEAEARRLKSAYNAYPLNSMIKLQKDTAGFYRAELRPHVPIGNLSYCVEAALQLAAEEDMHEVSKISDTNLNEALIFLSAKVKAKEWEKIEYNSWKNLISILKTSKESLFFKGLNNKELIFYCEGKFTTVKISSNFANLLIKKSCRAHSNDMPYYSHKTKKENDKVMMKMPAMNMEFGPVSDNIAISPYGLAVRNKNDTWMTYNPSTKQTVDVTGFTFDFNGLIYKMPVGINTLTQGDMIIHQGRPMYVEDIEGSNVSAVDILCSEAKTIIPVTNMFGFNFVTKIVSLINLGTSDPNPDQPFGNLMPMMMASMVFGNDSDSAFGDMDMSKLMMMSMMTGNANPFGNLFNFGNLAGTQSPSI